MIQPPGTPNTLKANIQLTSSRLNVAIAYPGTAYAGTRFDWTGFVTQVTLDGKHTFCMPESLVPGEGTGGIGLCNEFGIEQAIGYDETKPGEPFPKLGIGLLARPDKKPYNFFRPHTIVEPFPIQVDTQAAEVRFVVDPIECQGYAARLVKTLSVHNNVLNIAYQLENVGKKIIDTREYAHNFMGIDKQPVSPDYTLKFATPLTPEPMPRMRRMGNILDIQGDTMCLKELPKHAFYARLQSFGQTTEPQWTLIHTPSGVRMMEIDDFEPVRIAVWGTAHVISAEIFGHIHVQPGETQRWTRRYRFETE